MENILFIKSRWKPFLEPTSTGQYLLRFQLKRKKQGNRLGFEFPGNIMQKIAHKYAVSVCGDASQCPVHNTSIRQPCTLTVDTCRFVNYETIQPIKMIVLLDLGK